MKKYLFYQWDGVQGMNGLFHSFDDRSFVKVYKIWQWIGDHRSTSTRINGTIKVCKVGDWIIVDEDGNFFQDLNYLEDGV